MSDIASTWWEAYCHTKGLEEDGIYWEDMKALIRKEFIPHIGRGQNTMHTTIVEGMREELEHITWNLQNFFDICPIEMKYKS